MFFKVLTFNDESDMQIGLEIVEGNDPQDEGNDLQDAAKNFLDSIGLKFEELDIENEKGAMEIYLEDVDGANTPGHFVIKPWNLISAKNEFLLKARNIDWSNPEDLTRVFHFLAEEG